jgi:hypothetical protein
MEYDSLYTLVHRRNSSAKAKEKQPPTNPLTHERHSKCIRDNKVLLVEIKER